MAEEVQTAGWAEEVTSMWLSGRIDQCHELMMQHLNVRWPGGWKEGSGSSVAMKEKTGSGQSLSRENLGSTGVQSEVSGTEVAVAACQNAISELIMEQAYETIHNVLLTHFLATGESLRWKWADLASMRMSMPVEAVISASQRSASVPVGTVAVPGKPSALNQLVHFKAPAHSKLDPHAYPRDSFEASLAALGPVHPLAWYNLIVLQTARNQFRLALKSCEDVLEHLFPTLIELNHPLSIKIGLLFLYLVIKLNYASHPKHTNVLNDLEKVLNFRIASTSGNENLICLEQNVWFHILRAQHSLIHLRMKSSKREGSSMMAAYSKWLTERTEAQIQAATAESSSSPKSPSSSSLVGDPVSCAMQFVKCRLLDLRSNQEKADAELQDASILSIAAAPFYNNLGVLAFHRRKFAVASLYFLKASQENQKMRQAISMQVPNDTRRHVSESVMDISTDVTYNMGLQMLMLGQFEGALRCFQEVSQKNAPGTLSSSQAMAYLRLAEARLAVYCSRIANLASSTQGKTPTAASPSSVASPSTSSLRSTSPTSSTSTSTSMSSSSSSLSSSSSTQSSNPKLISEIFREGGFLRLQRIRGSEHDVLLEMASQAANTALLLFERFGRAGTPAPVLRGPTAHKDASNNFTLTDRSHLTARDYLMRVYTHVLLTWISLENGNIVKALEHVGLAIATHTELESSTVTAAANSQQLSASEKSELDHYFFLAHLYKAEAELRSGNIDAALAGLTAAPIHLAKYPLIPYTHPYAHRSNKDILAMTNPPQTPQTGSPTLSHATVHTGPISSKTALLCNMAAVYLVKKDLAQAQKLLSQVLTQSPNLLPAVALQIYLELCVGNVELAVRLMCDFRVQDLLCIR